MKPVILFDLPCGIIEIGGAMKHIELPPQHVARLRSQIPRGQHGSVLLVALHQHRRPESIERSAEVGAPVGDACPRPSCRTAADDRRPRLDHDRVPHPRRRSEGLRPVAAHLALEHRQPGPVGLFEQRRLVEAAHDVRVRRQA